MPDDARGRTTWERACVTAHPSVAMDRKLVTLCAIISVAALHDLGAHAAPTRVLFVGNSFTFVNDLPHQLINIATSLGDDLEVANSTIGGCTLYHQTPSRDVRTASLLKQRWDFIVLQDYSALPTVHAARSVYLRPAVAEFIAEKQDATIVMYLTWGYHDGNTAPCPSSDTPDCFPKGSLANLTNPPCDSSPHFHNLTGTFECMGYALARAYLSLRRLEGVDLVAPCGLAWQVVRGSTEIPSECRASVDAQYPQPLSLSLPFKVPGGARPGFMLYRKFGDAIDKHPNVAGQYLNALTFYATLFRKSPVGAAAPLPTGSTSAGDRPLTPSEQLTLQVAAQGTVEACGSACGSMESSRLG